MLYALIMAGGSGTRFWPASRKAMPKQLLNLVGGQTMLQATVDRLGALVPPDRIMVVTNQRLVDPIARQLPGLLPEFIVGEPNKRDTAPCVGLAAALLVKADPQATMVVMPADHVIQSTDLFQRAVTQAEDAVERNPDTFVTFGIRPTYAAESFGYVERGEPLPTTGGAHDQVAPIYEVLRFREKPSADVARQYCASGNYYWNSGIFVWKAARILEALRQFEPDMHAHVTAIADAAGGPDFQRTMAEEFEAIAGKSIDYAVMEHYDHVAVIEAPFDWDDVGSWRSLARMRGADEAGNTLVGKALPLRTTNAILRSSEDHLVVAVGLENIIVVHTPDATLVMNREDEESVREVVRLIEQNGWDEYL